MNFKIEKIAIRKNTEKPKEDLVINNKEKERSIKKFCETVLILLV